MSQKCRYSNPLIHHGTNRIQRRKNRPDPDKVQLDERTLPELMKYVLDYSESLQYYNFKQEAEGNWRPFFEKDISFLIAFLSQTDLQNERDRLSYLVQVIETTIDRRTSETALLGLFQSNFSIFLRLNRWISQVPDTMEWSQFLHRELSSGMTSSIKELLACYKGAVASPSLLLRAEKPALIYEGEWKSWEDVTRASVRPFWYDSEGTGLSWKDYVKGITANNDVYGPGRRDSGIPTYKKIRRALPFLKAISNDFQRILTRIKRQSEYYFNESIENYSVHEPHTGLLISFLKLFSHAQNDLNTYTGRHLDYFYEDVLRIRPGKAIPDSVFLIGEVAKHIQHTKIPKGTLLKAGKDKTGIEVFYKVDQDRFLNKSAVSEIKSVFIDESEMYAVPEVLSEEDSSYEPSSGHPLFGKAASGETQNGWHVQPGFAVASPLLRMKEGKRKVELTFERSNAVQTPAEVKVQARITTQEGWYEAEVTSRLEQTVFVVEFEVPADEAPIYSFDPELHESSYDVDEPVLEIRLKKSSPDSGYSVLKGLRVKNLTLKIHVSGVRDLVLQNSFGMVDPSKPMQLFGPIPQEGSRFLIGSSEIFSKKVKDITVRFSGENWNQKKLKNAYQNYKERNGDNFVSISFPEDDLKVASLLLTSSDWKELEEVSFFDGKEISFSASDLEKAWENARQMELIRMWKPGLKSGFIGFELKGPKDPFWHRLYRQKLSEFAVHSAYDAMPSEPFVPEMNGVTLDYIAEETIDLGLEESANAGKSHLFSLYPFGHRLVEKQRMDDESVFLFPSFAASTEAGTEQYQAELYIGLKHCEAPQLLSLLFAVQEGSEHPDFQRTPIRWFYLKNGEWVRFIPEVDYSDETQHLTKTGIITFQIPGDISKNDRLFYQEEPHSWIKAAVTRNAGRFPKIRDIKAQAFRAHFLNHQNDPEFLSEALPKETISRFAESRHDIKSIQQPWPAIRGRTPEQKPEFYQRVSERLRHKNRAITIHDYERLVLQQYPDLFLVKCINHSVYDHVGHDGLFSAEFAPGYVSMLIVPDLTNEHLSDPLRPAASYGRRLEIQSYLQGKLPAFVAGKLSVINPEYEEVEIIARVQLKEGADAGFYKTRISDELKAFLSPWIQGHVEKFELGGSVHKSVIVSFIDKMEFVGHVVSVKMYQYQGGQRMEVDVATASSARSVLTSFSEHTIDTEGTK
ncbi:hypothetical protein QLX67_07780 [Balneolaceae bacterium ANBcel3]|nr:hypothetical protein [Balneolaceae bacterium ANBcel3]